MSPQMLFDAGQQPAKNLLVDTRGPEGRRRRGALPFVGQDGPQHLVEPLSATLEGPSKDALLNGAELAERTIPPTVVGSRPCLHPVDAYGLEGEPQVKTSGIEEYPRSPECRPHRVVANVREQYRRDVGVLLQDFALGDAQLWPERLTEIGRRRGHPR
jgi:hypothetical protein